MANILLTIPKPAYISPFMSAEKRPYLGVMSLYSILKKHGHNVWFYDRHLDLANDFILDNSLINKKIDFLGIYTNTVSINDAKQLIYRSYLLRKKKLWNGKIICGGPHSSLLPESLPAEVDFIVKGEGEKSILDIIDGSVKNRIVKNKRIIDLDKVIPFSPWDMIFKLPYSFDAPFANHNEYPVVTLNTSRGCPFKCNFCSAKNIWSRKYTCFSIPRVINEIQYLIKKYEVKGVYFREDNFTVYRKRVIEFAETLIKKNINIKWYCETRVDAIDEELLQLLYKSGCRGFYFGVESGSQRILDMLNKGTTAEQNYSALNLCGKLGISVYASMIYGIPGETKKDRELTQRLIDETKPSGVGYNIYTGLPGSEIYNMISEKSAYKYKDENGIIFLNGHNNRVKKYYRNDYRHKINRKKIFYNLQKFDSSFNIYYNHLFELWKNKYFKNKSKVLLVSGFKSNQYCTIYEKNKSFKVKLDDLFVDTKYYNKFDILIIKEFYGKEYPEFLKDFFDKLKKLLKTKSRVLGIGLGGLVQLDADRFTELYKNIKFTLNYNVINYFLPEYTNKVITQIAAGIAFFDLSLYNYKQKKIKPLEQSQLFKIKKKLKNKKLYVYGFGRAAEIVVNILDKNDFKTTGHIGLLNKNIKKDSKKLSTYQLFSIKPGKYYFIIPYNMWSPEIYNLLEYAGYKINQDFVFLKFDI